MSALFRNKTIIIISQQDWGKMLISKHHYAIELARLGNKVYFMNSPEKSGELKSGEIRVESTTIENLWVIKHRFYYPYLLKHRLPALHRWLLKYHIHKVYKKIGNEVDIVWSFDFSDTINLSSFPGSSYKIFMPVDNPIDPKQDNNGDVMFSVTQEILDAYKCDTPKMFVNHGVAENFINHKISLGINNPIQVGISGNFLRTDIDWQCLLDIITNNKHIIFNFWGSFDFKESNLVAKPTNEAEPYKKLLSGMGNVHIHGAVDVQSLSDNLKKMDCFLITYDIDKDHSKGTNYHKVLEYLASGKVIVSNNITTYQGTGLIEMPVERDNKNLPTLFANVVNNLAFYNSFEQQSRRIAYAQKHTYANNIKAIEAFIIDNNKRGHA